MLKILNIFFVPIVVIFFWGTYIHYISNKNINAKEFNRSNIDLIINKKILNLPILINDTANIIEFNNSISDKVNNDKPRSFWNLLKSK